MVTGVNQRWVESSKHLQQRRMCFWSNHTHRNTSHVLRWW